MRCETIEDILTLASDADSGARIMIRVGKMRGAVAANRIGSLVVLLASRFIAVRGLANGFLPIAAVISYSSGVSTNTLAKLRSFGLSAAAVLFANRFCN